MNLPGETRIVRDPAALADLLERVLYQTLAEAMETRGAACAMLAGGATPKAAYRLFATRRIAAAAAIESQFFVTDERLMPGHSVDSNSGELARLLLDPLGIPASNRHFPDGAAADPAAEARRITEAAQQVAPMTADGIPRFDVVLLGMGSDGHTASLFPATAALDIGEAGYVVNEVPALNTSRITATFPLINAAGLVIVACSGGQKAPVLREIASRGLEPRTYPIEQVQGEHLLWIFDEEAAP